MGMFDYVRFAMDCPKCGDHLTDFQSKDGGCNMDYIDVEQVSTFYCSCRSCGHWVQFSRKDRGAGIHRTATLKDVLELGFVQIS